MSNIIFIDRQPKEVMASHWSLCDLSLIHLKNEPLFAQVIPTKLFESMGMGIPVIMALPEGEATSLVNNYGCGVVITTENGEKLAHKILELKSAPERLKLYRQLALKSSLKFSRDSKAREMLIVLKKVVFSYGTGSDI